MHRFGHYLLRRELGRGGTGVVHLAWDERLGREVALKLIRSADLDQERDRERFLQEARVMARLVHPNVVRLLDAGEAEGQLFIATELIEGEDLHRLVAREGPLAPERAVAIARGLADALDAAHGSGILHRDVKPHNVLLTRDATPKLLDFGLAREEEARRLTVTGEVLGTPAFMAPEQATGERELQGPATDVYGLGITLYFLLSGSSPFQGTSAISILRAVMDEPPPRLGAAAPGIDPELERIVQACLAKQPADRPGSAAEVGRALQTWQARQRASKPASRGAAATIVAATLLALGACAVLLLLGLRTPRSPGPSVTPAHLGPQPAASRHLDGATLGDPGAWPALEVAAPLGLVVAPDRPPRLQAGGQTRTALRLPVQVGGDTPFRVRAELELELLEPSTRLTLALQPEASPQEWVGLSLVGLGASWIDPLGGECEARARTSQEASSAPLSLLPPRERLQLEISYEPAPSPRFALRVLRGGTTCLDCVGALPAPLAAGAWSVVLGANLELPGLAGASPGDPASQLRATLVDLELDGLPEGASRATPRGVLGRSGRALLFADPDRRARAREALDPLARGDGELPAEARWLRLLLSDPERARLSLDAEWTDPALQARWRLELPRLPVDLRQVLARVYRERQLAGHDSNWALLYSLYRVWGDKGKLKGPAELEEREGWENYYLRGETARAFAYLSEADLAFEAQGLTNGDHAGAQGVAALWTGQLERGRELIRHEAEQGNRDAFMHTHWGFAAFRLGDDATALECWEKAKSRPGRGGPWSPVRERLEARAAARLRAAGGPR